MRSTGCACITKNARHYQPKRNTGYFTTPSRRRTANQHGWRLVRMHAACVCRMASNQLRFLQTYCQIAMRVGSGFRSFVLPGAEPHDRSADFVCPDFHGARHLGRPSGCYQFPRTSFRSFVIVALGPATTAGLLTLTCRVTRLTTSTRLATGLRISGRKPRRLVLSIAMRVAPVSKGLPVTFASGDRLFTR